MIASLNEIEAMVWKAARGAGLAWGLAEELGQAARWLADRDLDWPDAVVACLAEVERRKGELSVPVLVGDVWIPGDANTPSSPALCGPLLSDLAGAVTAESALAFERIAQPLLMLPFAGRAAESTGVGFSLVLDGLRVSFRGLDLYGSVPATGWPAVAQRVTLRMESAPIAAPLIPRSAPRHVIAADALAQLEAWVHRTYVPASATSRLAGAGAGLTDND